jgi:hypothetical protein
MDTRKIARITGWLLIVTFVASIPAVFIFYAPVLDDARYILGGGADTKIAVGAFLEMIVIVANIGTAVALFSILKRQSEGLALGYVTARVVESMFIAVGLLSLLSVTTMRQTGGDAASLSAVSGALVAIHDWTFLLGPGWIVGLGNGLILGYLMYRSRLVPRRLSMLGLIGGPLILASGTAILFGAFEAGSTPQVIATFPEFFWELLLGIYLIVKGFDRSPALAASDERTVTADAEVSRQAA